MAQRRNSRSSRSSGRARSSRSGYSSRSAGRRTSRATAPRKSSRRSSGRRTARTPQTVRIVLEHAGSAPVREGQQVDIGMKVAKAPRTKPRF